MNAIRTKEAPVCENENNVEAENRSGCGASKPTAGRFTRGARRTNALQLRKPKTVRITRTSVPAKKITQRPNSIAGRGRYVKSSLLLQESEGEKHSFCGGK